MAINIQGLREAVIQERFVRDASFQDITESVGEFELRPMTLRDYITLSAIGNPLVAGGIPDLYQMASFLWLLSPGYNPNDKRARKRFFKRCRFLVAPTPPLFGLFKPFYKRRAQKHEESVARMLVDVLKFVAESMQDRPAPTVREKPQYYSPGAAWVGALAREYGWSESDILDLPLKRLFQYYKEILAGTGKEPLCNPSDEIKGRWIAEQNRRN